MKVGRGVPGQVGTQVPHMPPQEFIKSTQIVGHPRLVVVGRELVVVTVVDLGVHGGGVYVGRGVPGHLGTQVPHIPPQELM